MIDHRAARLRYIHRDRRAVFTPEPAVQLLASVPEVYALWEGGFNPIAHASLPRTARAYV